MYYVIDFIFLITVISFSFVLSKYSEPKFLKSNPNEKRKIKCIQKYPQQKLSKD